MRLLLDTHVALWAIAADRRLPPAVASLIAEPANDIIVSAASIWEIAIKHALARGGPNDVRISGADAMSFFREAGYDFLPVHPEHAAAVDSLPAHHGDPFDRLLVAQALREPLRLISHDAVMAAYSDAFIIF